MKEIKNYYIAYNRGRIEERKRILKIIDNIDIRFLDTDVEDFIKELKAKLQEKTA